MLVTLSQRARLLRQQQGLTLRCARRQVRPLAAVPDGRRSRPRQHLGPPAGRPRGRAADDRRRSRHGAQPKTRAARHRPARAARRGQDRRSAGGWRAASNALRRARQADRAARRHARSREIFTMHGEELLSPPRTRDARRPARAPAVDGARRRRRPRHRAGDLRAAPAADDDGLAQGAGRRLLDTASSARATAGRSTSTRRPAKPCASWSRAATRSTRARSIAVDTSSLAPRAGRRSPSSKRLAIARPKRSATCGSIRRDSAPHVDGEPPGLPDPQGDVAMRRQYRTESAARILFGAGLLLAGYPLVADLVAAQGPRRPGPRPAPGDQRADRSGAAGLPVARRSARSARAAASTTSPSTRRTRPPTTSATR